jgi:hypothetical protein
VKVFDKSERTDGTFSRADFAYDAECDLYVCPGGKELRKRRVFSSLRPDVAQDGTIIHRASKLDCDGCAHKPAPFLKPIATGAGDRQDRSLRHLTPRAKRKSRCSSLT